jgi:hypothetical protein
MNRKLLIEVVFLVSTLISEILSPEIPNYFRWWLSLILVSALVYLISIEYIKDKNENKLRFDIIKKVKESVKANDNEPVDSDWHILIHSPNRPAKQCKIWLNNKPLPWHDNNGMYYRDIPSGGGGNAMIPRNEFPEDNLWNAKDKIMEKNKICKEFVFFYLDEG